MNQDLLLSQRIEILSLGLFDTHKMEMNLIEQYQKNLNTALGWHYYLDVAWIIKELNGLPEGSLVLDAGAGSGILQFILSDLGYNVISVDFMERSFPANYLKRYGHKIALLESPTQTFDNTYIKYLQSCCNINIHGHLSKLRKLFNSINPKIILHSIIKEKYYNRETKYNKLLLKGNFISKRGFIFLYKCDLKNMPLLAEGLCDAIVSVSALEHNDHKDFEKCMDEILRVTKPSGKLIITTSASRSEDWFHEPSKGWCYSETTIRKLLRIPEYVQSNFSKIDSIFEEMIKEGNQLHQRLSPVYLLSGDNGMPWGKWNPQYLPVGIVKIKSL